MNNDGLVGNLKLVNFNKRLAVAILERINAVMYGDFQLKNGQRSNVYFDFRNLFVHPDDLDFIATQLAMLVPKTAKSITAVPLGALPIATIISQKLSLPLIVVRKDAKKTYGTCREIEIDPSTSYEFSPTVIIEDVVTTGSSIAEIESILKNANIRCVDSVAILNRNTTGEYLNTTKLTSFLSTADFRSLELEEAGFANKIYQRIRKIGSKLCISLDIAEPSAFIKMFDTICGYSQKVVAIKTHFDITLLTPKQLEYFKDCLKITGILWIEDRKFSDIGSIMISQYDAFIKENAIPDFVTIHPVSGKESLAEFIKHVSKKETGTIVVANMSSSNNLCSESYSSSAITWATELGACGVVSQTVAPKNIITFTPGINLDNSVLTDGKGQQYKQQVTTDIAIVGRAIINSDTPEMQIERYSKELLWRAGINEQLPFPLPLFLLFRKGFVYNAAGVHCTTPEELAELADSDSCVIQTKSCTLEPLEGNPKPRYYLDNDISINSTGLANLGIREYIKQSHYFTNKPYILSIAGRTLEEFTECVKLCNDDCKDISAYEINLSCPNIIGKPVTATEFVESFLQIADQLTCPWGIKLPPFFNQSEIDEYLTVVKRHNATFVVCSNSFPNGLILNHELQPAIIPRNGLGGVGGTYGFKAISLANARYIIEKFNIPVIGCGGVRNAKDVFDYLSIGCLAVQIGSHLDRAGMKLFECINQDIRRCCT